MQALFTLLFTHALVTVSKTALPSTEMSESAFSCLALVKFYWHDLLWLTPAAPEGITPTKVEAVTEYITPLKVGVPLIAALTKLSLDGGEYFNRFLRFNRWGSHTPSEIVPIRTDGVFLSKVLFVRQAASEVHRDNYSQSKKNSITALTQGIKRQYLQVNRSGETSFYIQRWDACTH